MTKMTKESKLEIAVRAMSGGIWVSVMVYKPDLSFSLMHLQYGLTLLAAFCQV